MDTYKDTRPYLLSKVLDLHFVGTKEEIEIRKIANSSQYEFLYNTNEDQAHLVGSVGDGFKSELCSDMDFMYINNGSVVMYPYMYQGVTPRNSNKTVLLIREADCRPGYVHLEIGHLGRHVTQEILKAIVPVLNSRFLSSDIFRENPFGTLTKTSPLSVGPSNLIKCYGNHVDIVRSFPCICWPSDAWEWCCRPRVFGWPNEALVKQIISKGCHLVPIGDKCSDDTFLQWRFSFVIAEQQLVHSFNYIQFKVYGLLKYVLKQIKYRIKRDIGDDILCSYFMKTLILYSVENSPQSLWQEKNIFVCFWFCFTTLLDWVHSGYCPNYFIPASNMFQRKIHGENKIKLLNILCELHQMNWNILSIGNAYERSILALLQTPEVEKIHLQTPSETEHRKDKITVECFNSYSLSTSLKMLLKSNCNAQQTLAFGPFVTYTTDTAIDQYKRSEYSHGNKARYSSLMKCKRLLTLSFGSDILHLATFFYQTGNYKKAIEVCEKDVPLVTVYSLQYKAMYCGKGNSTFKKMKHAYSAFVLLKPTSPEMWPSELLPELRSMILLPLPIPQAEYCLFLLFLSYFNLGDIRKSHKVLQEMEWKRHIKDFILKPKKLCSWITHTLVGICHQTLGDYHSAIQAYRDSLKVPTKVGNNPAMERIKALQSKIVT